MKKLLSLILCLCMILSFAGCGAENADEEPSSDIYTDESSETENTSSDQEDDDGSSENNSSSKKSNTSKKTQTSTKSGSSYKTSTSAKDTSSAKRYPTKLKSILIRRVNRQYFKQVGRCDLGATTGLSLNWSCSSLEFDLDCTDEITLSFKKTGSTRVFLEIYLDGKLIEERTEITASGDLTIAKDLAPGVHRVKLIRQTDCEGAQLSLESIYTYGSLVEKAPADKELYIEAIGDASLIGWGVRLEDSFYTDDKFVQATARDKENEDGTLSYAYVAAEKLNADCYILARQGVGIVATYHRSNGVAIPSAGLLPTIYEQKQIGKSGYTATRTPDVIVVDAGITDINRSLLSAVQDGDTVGVDQTRADEITADFFKNLKKNNPGVKIIWCYGITSDNADFEKHVKSIISELGGDTAGFYALKLKTSTRRGYPSKSEYATAATTLANKIKAITK